MDDNNIEEKDMLDDQTISEESLEQSINETEEIDEAKVEIAKDRVSFIKSFAAIIIDNAFIGIISFILLYVFNFLLGLAGYSITQKGSMLLIIFVIVSIFYNSICESSKNSRTIGKRLLKF